MRNDQKPLIERLRAMERSATVSEYSFAKGYYAREDAETLREAIAALSHQPVAGDGAGFPDLVLVRERVIFAELKSETGRLSPEQKTWGDKLFIADCEIYNWRPSDWDKIIKILEGRD